MSSTVIVTSVALTFARGIIVINEIVRSYITAMISPAEPNKFLKRKNHGHRLSNENCRHCYYSPQTSQPRGQKRGGVTAFWASPRFGHPHSHIPSVLGIPFSYYCSVLGIPRYPPGMPKSLVFWSSPPKNCWISRENRKRFRDGFR